MLNIKTTYAFVNTQIKADNNTAIKLTAIINFTDWENKEAILSTFTFLSSYNKELIMKEVGFKGGDGKERQYRKEVFGERYSNWMTWIFNVYCGKQEASDLRQEMITIFSAAKKAAIIIISLTRKEEIIVMTKAELESYSAQIIKNALENDRRNNNNMEVLEVTPKYQTSTVPKNKPTLKNSTKGKNNDTPTKLIFS